MIRVAGALLLLAAAFGFGVSMRRQEKRHIRALESALTIIQHARRNIELFDTPLDELFSDYPESADTALREALQNKPLGQAIAPLLQDMEEEAELMRKFARELGSGYKDDALKLCDYTEKRLEERLRKMKGDYPARAKLYTALPLLFALSVILLLI